MTLKVIQSYRNCRHLIGRIYHFLLVVCSNNDSILHRFRDTFPVYVTAYDLQKSFSFDEKAKITSHVRFLNHITCKHIVINSLICYISQDIDYWTMHSSNLSLTPTFTTSPLVYSAPVPEFHANAPTTL